MPAMQLQLPLKPDFILIGAMKSGTTTLHHALESHPHIFIPRGEIHLFTIDEIEEHPQVFGGGGQEWVHQNFERYAQDYARWYQDLFKKSLPGQLLGEDSASYLSSRRAIDRIAAYLPDTKLLVMLRDPVERLYSHYWHWVRSYRAIYSLEDTIRFQHGNLLQRSLYEEQLRYCFDHVDRERVKVIVFEEFIENQKELLNSVLRFLGLSDGFNGDYRERHSNQGKIPRNLSLALLQNRLLRNQYGQQYRGRVPRLSGGQKPPLSTRAAIRFFRVINPERRRKVEPMRADTRAFLSQLLFDRNRGLPELVGVDLARYWPTFQR